MLASFLGPAPTLATWMDGPGWLWALFCAKFTNEPPRLKRTTQRCCRHWRCCQCRVRSVSHQQMACPSLFRVGMIQQHQRDARGPDVRHLPFTIRRYVADVGRSEYPRQRSVDISAGGPGGKTASLPGTQQLRKESACLRAQLHQATGWFVQTPNRRLLCPPSPFVLCNMLVLVQIAPATRQATAPDRKKKKKKDQRTEKDAETTVSKGPLPTR